MSVLAGFSSASLSAILPGTSCDVDVMDIMEAKAWMEGKREMEAAQLLILKPDSVLEYSCFKTRLQQLAFLPPWSNIEGNMGTALNNLVGEPTDEFLKNFSHGLGGGTHSGNVTCDAMSAVWETLKCNNMEKADFWTFQELLDKDPRVLPKACNEGMRTATWDMAILSSNTEPDALGGVDDFESYLKRMNSSLCGTPIPTGLMVFMPKGNSYADAVCSAPGCYYNGSSCNKR